MTTEAEPEAIERETQIEKSSSYVLGLSYKCGETGAALFLNGACLVSIQESMLSGVKHDDSSIPFKSIDYVLDTIGLNLDDICQIAIATPDPGFIDLEDYRTQLEQTQGLGKLSPDLAISVHSLDRCEAALAYHTGSKPDSLTAVLGLAGSIDDQDSLWMTSQTQFELLSKLSQPLSISYFTELLMLHSAGEIVDHNKFTLGITEIDPDLAKTELYQKVREILDKAIYLNEQKDLVASDKFMELLEEDDLDASQIINLIVSSNLDGFENEMSDPRFEEIITLAGFEKIVSLTIEILKFYQQETNTQGICLSGDWTKSVYFNRKILESGLTHQLSINPLNGGVASHIGAGLIASREITETKLPSLDTVYLGREYSKEKLKRLLVERGCDYEEITKPSELAAKIADLLAEGEVVALFQDRSEQGERALGNRNIIAALAFEESSAKVNQAKIADPQKKVAMAITAEQASELFCGLVPSPYMQFEFDFESRVRDQWPHLERFHVRPHIVDQDQNPLYWQILKNLGDKTGLAGAYKSSFNRSGKIVPETPEQAVDLINELRGSGLGYLALGPFLINL